MSEDSPIPIAVTSKSGRVLRSRKAGLEVKRGTVKSTSKNDQRKLKRVMEMKHSSSGAAKMDGGMEFCHLRVQGVETGIEGKRNCDFYVRTCKELVFRLSKIALEDYNSKNQDDEFEVVQALHAQKRLLHPLDNRDDVEEWCHVFFVGQSKDGTVKKNFFAELMRQDRKFNFSVKSCFALDPGDFDHGCLICPPGLHLHPQEGQFLAKKSSYAPVKIVMV